MRVPWPIVVQANVARLISGYGKVPIRVILAQAAHETGGFRSDIYRENRNLFGMKLPSHRPTTALSENRGHAVYSSTWKSMLDYFMRQREFNIPNTDNVDLYMYETQRSGYAEDESYIDKWKAILSQI